jgi:type IV pilus assembly protein PilC
MVKAGEESGNLAGSLKVIAIQMDKSYALSRKVKGALIYPAVIFSVMVVIGVLMMVYMVPTLTATFKGLGVDLPLSTRIVIGISDFLRNHFLIVFLAVVAVIVTIAALLKTKAGSRAFDYFILHLPVIGTIVKEVNSARTTRTLSSLLSSGVDVVVALGVTEEVIQNSFYKEVLGKAHENIQKGDPISAVFIEHENLYPIFVGEMMNVGEETGKMADMLLGVAAYYEDEVDQKTKDMSTIIEPVLMVIIGIAVGIFAISMLAPTYSLVDKI